VDFLAQFTYEQIRKVIKEYSSILLPKFPFELSMIMHENDYKTEEELKQQMSLNSNGQNLWFSHMTSVEFSR
jgi:predicted metal-binding protein